MKKISPYDCIEKDKCQLHGHDTHHDHHIASTLLTLVLNIAVRRGWDKLRVISNMALEEVSVAYRKELDNESKGIHSRG